MRNKQHGFGIIETILVLVIVGLIAFVGWYVYNAQQEGTTNGTSQDAQSESVPEVNNSSDLEEAEEFIESKDVDKQLDTGEIEESLY